MNKVLKFLTSKNFTSSVVATIILLLVYFILKKVINKYIDENSHLNKRKATYLKLLKSMTKYIVFIVLIIFLLEINGINITSIIAGLGIVSVVAGLALQDALKDIIMGFNLIIDDYFSVGDVVKIDDFEGKVLSLGIKTTKLMNINSGQIMVIANRNISKALIMTDGIPVDVPLPYELTLTKSEKVINEICEEIKKLEHVESVSYSGIDEFASSQIIYKLCIMVKDFSKIAIKRQANVIIKKILDEKRIEIPYEQLDIHNK